MCLSIVVHRRSWGGQMCPVFDVLRSVLALSGSFSAFFHPALQASMWRLGRLAPQNLSPLASNGSSCPLVTVVSLVVGLRLRHAASLML